MKIFFLLQDYFSTIAAMNCALHLLLLAVLLIIAGNDGIDVVDKKVNTKDDNGSTEVDQSPGLFGQIVSKSKKSDLPKWNCPYTSRLYEELRMNPKVTYQGGVRKECTAPGNLLNMLSKKFRFLEEN